MERTQRGGGFGRADDGFVGGGGVVAAEWVPTAEQGRPVRARRTWPSEVVGLG